MPKLSPILVLLALSLSSCGGNQRTPLPPRIVFAETSFDAGHIEQGEKVTHTFHFHNEGDIDLQITQVRSSCGCITTTPDKMVVPPGGNGEIEVTFNTTSYFGRNVRTTSVLSNDPQSPLARLRIIATINYDVAIDPPHIYVGKVKRGASVRTFPRVLIGDDRDVRFTNIESKSKIVKVDWAAVGSNERERRLAVSIQPDAPAGAFRESILIHTTSERRPVMAVSIIGTVEQATEKLLSNEG